jgi:hypothetical protein
VGLLRQPQCWIKTATVAKVGVPLGGLLLVKKGIIQPSLRNNIIIKGISILPSIVAVGGIVWRPLVVEPANVMLGGRVIHIDTRQ